MATYLGWAFFSSIIIAIITATRASINREESDYYFILPQALFFPIALPYQIFALIFCLAGRSTTAATRTKTIIDFFKDKSIEEIAHLYEEAQKRDKEIHTVLLFDYFPKNSPEEFKKQIVSNNVSWDLKCYIAKHLIYVPKQIEKDKKNELEKKKQIKEEQKEKQKLESDYNKLLNSKDSDK